LRMKHFLSTDPVVPFRSTPTNIELQDVGAVPLDVRAASGDGLGAHGLRDEVVVRRFAVGLRNFDRVYKPLVDAWALYDNSGEGPVLIEEEGKP
jgi:hypothetical protein